MARFRYRTAAAAALVTLALMGGATANDTTANLAAGGLVFQATDAIEMRREELFLSQDRVSVRYEFVNAGSDPVSTIVAFPMPDIRINPYGGDVAIPSGDPDNPLAFSTRVDGAAVTMDLEQKVLVDDRDVTATMQRLRLPFAPQADAARRALDALPPEDRKTVLDGGIAVEESYDAGQGWETHLVPDWSLRATYHWNQTFAPGTTIVEHDYAPSVGGSVGTMLGQSWADPDELARMRQRYCIEDDFMATVERRTRAAGPDTLPFQERWIDYILVTGGNWAKPIGDFNMVIDKGAPENLVSFCASGVKKIAPTRFEVRKRDYTPREDLHVLILVPAGG
ncbi:DUF4424 family protein [Aurantimonas sp. A2-1-M11]|uniref:DUF4424 family protein n=1 Tax=Aurantimonas sp. A2-1-M11 TaxID=3113712 RepID=UPI002F9325A7